MHEALFWKLKDDTHLVCELCPRYCVLAEGQLGACGVRKAINSKLYAMTYGHPCSLAVDPVEKKPLFHFHPGENIFSLATIGCNLFCEFCQNWQISKERWEEPEMATPPPWRSLENESRGVKTRSRHTSATAHERRGGVAKSKNEIEVSPKQIIELAKSRGCRLIAFTYTEPTIYYEYALDIAKLAKKAGMECGIVSNGYICKEPLQKLIPFISAANIDLKGGKEFYKRVCKVPDSEVIKDTIMGLKKGGVHVEVTTLLIPGENDSDEEIEERAAWLAQHAGRETPLHLSAFHPDYKMLAKDATKKETLLRARDIAKRHLDFVYLGNVAGVENETRCPKCDAVVIERKNYAGVSHLRDGACPECGERLPGIF